MAKDTKVTFDNDTTVPNKPSSGRNGRPSRAAERQISYEETENCVNEMSENFPALSSKAHRLMRQVSESFNYRTIKVALILSVILNLLLGIPFGIFFGFWMSTKHESSSSSSSLSSSSSMIGLGQSGSLSGSGSGFEPTQSGGAERFAWNDRRSFVQVETCLKCKDMLKRFAPQYVDSHIKVRSHNGICCADIDPYYQKSAEVMQHIPSGSTGMEGSNHGPCPEHTALPRVSAHLMLNVKQTKINVKGSHLPNPMAWESSDAEGGRTFVTGGLQYSRGFLTISQSGHYHVYSHLTLSAIENFLGENVPEKLIVHSIWRKPANKPKITLLFAQVTLKVDEVKSTNIEGSFELEKGDVISVYVSHPSFLKEKKPANIFGLFKL